MEDIIIIAVLAAVVAFAIIRSIRHFKGGGCCGSGSTTIRSKKTLTAPVIREKLLTIEGMHCENCAIRIENALNRLEGVLCRVHLKKKTAIVSLSTEAADSLLKETVECPGYTVTDIR